MKFGPKYWPSNSNQIVVDTNVCAIAKTISVYLIISAWCTTLRFKKKCNFLKYLDPFVFVMLKKENQLLLGPLLMLLNSPENKLDKRKKGDHWGVLKHTAALGATKEKW